MFGLVGDICSILDIFHISKFAVIKVKHRSYCGPLTSKVQFGGVQDADELGRMTSVQGCVVD